MAEEVTTTQTQQSGSASTPVDVKPTMGTGTAGLETHVGGAPTTVSGVQNASGGMGELVLPEVDQRIFMFERGNYALMELMLMAKRVNVKSMEVKHYAIDQGTPIVTVNTVNNDGTITPDKITLAEQSFEATIQSSTLRYNKETQVLSGDVSMVMKDINENVTTTAVATIYGQKR